MVHNKRKAQCEFNDQETKRPRRQSSEEYRQDHPVHNKRKAQCKFNDQETKQPRRQSSEEYRQDHPVHNKRKAQCEFNDQETQRPRRQPSEEYRQDHPVHNKRKAQCEFNDQETQRPRPQSSEEYRQDHPVHNKRKAQCEFNDQETKRPRRQSSEEYRQDHLGKRQYKSGGGAFAGQRSTPQHVQNPIRSEQLCQQDKSRDNEKVTHGKVEPLTPCSDITIPILWSTQIDHTTSSSFEPDQWDLEASKKYHDAITLLKTGINRKRFGLPEAKESHGKCLNIDCVDLYFNIEDSQVYVASKQGLITVPNYLKLCGISLERKVRFNGKVPAWAKALFDGAKKRYVTEIFDEDTLSVRSEVQVYHTFQSRRWPTGLWGLMYSYDSRKVVEFPMRYTAEARPGPLSALEMKIHFTYPDKRPSPKELGEALFRQAEECDRGELDLNMTKTLDDYLNECGYMYGKYALVTTRPKRGLNMHEKLERIAKKTAALRAEMAQQSLEKDIQIPAMNVTQTIAKEASRSLIPRVVPGMIATRADWDPAEFEKMRQRSNWTSSYHDRAWEDNQL